MIVRLREIFRDRQESQTTVAPSMSVGTRPVGETSRTFCQSGDWNANFRCSKGMPRCFISTQGRSDHEE